MTASIKKRIQAHSIPLVQQAINTECYGEENRRIMNDIFVLNATYEQAAYNAHLSTRGLYKRVQPMARRIERKLTTS